MPTQHQPITVVNSLLLGSFLQFRNGRVVLLALASDRMHKRYNNLTPLEEKFWNASHFECHLIKKFTISSAFLLHFLAINSILTFVVCFNSESSLLAKTDMLFNLEKCRLSVLHLLLRRKVTFFKYYALFKILVSLTQNVLNIYPQNYVCEQGDATPQ